MPRLFRRLARADTVLFRRVARSHAPLLDRLLPELSRAADFSKLWLAISALLALAGGPSGKRAAARGLASLAVTSALVNALLKPLLGRTRPAIEKVPRARRLARLPKSTSLPSGHAASASAFATGVALELPSSAPLIGPLAGTVALSRIYTGVHYPSDVALGALVGAGVALLSRVPWPTVPAAGEQADRSSQTSGVEASGRRS